MAEFPSELLALPQPLIGFFGLDMNNASHKAIYDSFNNRVDRLLLFLVIIFHLINYFSFSGQRSNTKSSL